MIGFINYFLTDSVNLFNSLQTKIYPGPLPYDPDAIKNKVSLITPGRPSSALITAPCYHVFNTVMY